MGMRGFDGHSPCHGWFDEWLPFIRTTQGGVQVKQIFSKIPVHQKFSKDDLKGAASPTDTDANQDIAADGAAVTTDDIPFMSGEPPKASTSEDAALKGNEGARPHTK